MKNKLREEKITRICYLLASVCFYLSAVLEFTGTDGGNGAVNLCLGSAFLCLSCMHLSKDRDKNGKNQ